MGYIAEGIEFRCVYEIEAWIVVNEQPIRGVWDQSPVACKPRRVEFKTTCGLPVDHVAGDVFRVHESKRGWPAEIEVRCPQLAKELQEVTA